jgi:cytochrome c556
MGKFREQAEERKVTGKSEDGQAGGRGNKKVNLPQQIGEGLPKESRPEKHDAESDSQAAKLGGTNRQYIADARKLRETAPESFDAIKRAYRADLGAWEGDKPGLCVSDKKENPLSQQIDSMESDKNNSRSDSQAAKLGGTNRQYIADARKLRETAPESFDAIKRG